MHAKRLPVRGANQVRRRRTVRRASPRVSPLQVLAALAMAVFAAGIWVVSAAPAFSVSRIEIQGARFTSEAAIKTAAGLDHAGNTFRFRSDVAARRVAELPAVLHASVATRLPGTVAITVEERSPVLIWAAGDRRFAVDETGTLFGLVDDAGVPIASSAGPIVPRPSASPSGSAPPSATGPSGGPSGATAAPSATPSATRSTAPAASPSGAKASRSASPSGNRASPSPSIAAPSLAPAPTPAPGARGSLAVPVVVDRRAAAADLRLGDSIDLTTLDAAFRLAHLTPSDVGSTATALSVVVDDRYGFTVSSVPRGWVAEFGFYTLTVRRPETVVVYQVRDLKSLFGTVAEGKVGWVFLTSDLSSDHTSTYIPR